MEVAPELTTTNRQPPRSAVRSVSMAVAGAAVVISLVGVTKLLHQPHVSLVSGLTDGSITSLIPTSTFVTLTNDDWFRSIHVVDVTSSCGCTVPGTFDKRVPPLGAVRIPIQVEPRAFETQVSAIISVARQDASSTTLVHATIVPPFVGWPDRATPHRRADLWTIPFDSKYKNRILGGYVLARGSTSPMPATVDDDNLTITFGTSVPVSLDGTTELVLHFATSTDASQSWSVWLQHDSSRE